MFGVGKGRGMRQARHAWHQAVQIFKPNRLLKYFPPAFQLRNPAMSLLDLARKRGDTCGVVVLYLEGMSKLMMSCAAFLSFKAYILRIICTLDAPSYDKHVR